MKQKARHIALETLAKMIMPSMMEDIKMPEKKEIKKEMHDEDDYSEEKKDKKEKPKTVMSITRMMAMHQVPKKKEEPKKEFKGKK